MTTTTNNDRADRIATLYRTVDWLEAHPDKAIIGTMARDDEGQPCYIDDEEATCFCFIGRLVIEAGLVPSIHMLSVVDKWLAPLGIRNGTLMRTNDAYMDLETRVSALRGVIGRLA